MNCFGLPFATVVLYYLLASITSSLAFSLNEIMQAQISSSSTGGISTNHVKSPSKPNGSIIPPTPSISVPVWSLAVPSVIQELPETKDPGKPSSSMNIVTFATPVSISPKLWAISLYHDTLTKDSFLSAKVGVLQLLSREHKNLVPLLGKRSGYEENLNKEVLCRNEGFPWTSAKNFVSDSLTKHLDILPGCLSYIGVQVVSAVDAGDHVVAICKVITTGTWNKRKKEVSVSKTEDAPPPPIDEASALYTGYLRNEGIL